MLSEGEIPFRKIGRHRFVREEDLLDYKAKRDAERRRILDKIVRDAEEAGLYGERGRLLTACEGTGKEFLPPCFLTLPSRKEICPIRTRVN